jgi:cytochrome bd-type quinol oxidase subunit 2
MALENNRENQGSAIPLDRARLRLGILWLAGSGLIVFMLVAQSLMGKYGNKVQDVFGWAMPTIVPALSLILTVLGAGALVHQHEETQVKRSFFLIAYVLSLVYLFLVFAIIAVEPFTSFESLELLKLSNLWLAPLQGLVTSALSALFFTKQSKKE